MNYKSIAACDVELHALTFLVGVNGSGKSNFLDALRFVADSLRTSLDHAMRERGGIAEVRRRSSGHPNNFGIRLDFALPQLGTGHYAFRIASRPQGGYIVREEECLIRQAGGWRYYNVQDGLVTRSHLEKELLAVPLPAATPDRLYLVNASGLPDFRPVYDALSHMGFYNLNPDRIRDLQNPDAGDLLERDGGNLSSVLAQLERTRPQAVERIEAYLSKVVPGVTGVASKNIGPKDTLEFRQTVAGSKDPWRFLAASMSDGTLRAAGILTALFQSGNGSGGSRVPLIGIEEPEVALHPAAAGALRDCLHDASQYTQVIVTSHSPDLLDDPDIDPDSLLAVLANGGVTEIGPIDSAGRQVMRDHLFTAGELLRLNQLTPDPETIRQPRQIGLFDLDQKSSE